MNYGIKKDFAHTISFRKNMRASLTDDQKADTAAPAGDATENMAQWVTTFPEGVEVTEDLLTRGQQRFNIYCAACHGYAGQGDGLVNQKALALAANGDATWTAARSLHDAEVKGDAKNPVGRIFDTITNGRANMGPYKSQIPVADRWAIVAYVRALQETGLKTPGADEAAGEENKEEDKTEEKKDDA